MPFDPATADSQWSDALTAARLFAVDAVGCGVLVKAQAGPVRDRWLAHVRSLLPGDAPVRRLPAHITDSRLLGGLDLIATLSAGRPVVERGLLAEADGGVVILPMAERMSPGLAGRLVAVMDSRKVMLERDGLTLQLPARFGVIALNEGVDEEEPPPSLPERLALHVDLEGLRHDCGIDDGANPVEIAAARARLSQVEVPDAIVEAICAAAFALGCDSMRASLLALNAAKASAALAGHTRVTAEDAALAARLVLAPRATRLPQEAADDRAMPPADPEPPDTEDAGKNHESPPPPGDEDRSTDAAELGEQLVDIAQAAIPAGLLASIANGAAGVGKSRTSGRSGATTASGRRGRPAGVRKGAPRAGVPLNVVETLRAAAPWQKLRHHASAVGSSGKTRRIDVRAEDFHVTRYRQRTETTTVFVLDASGSTALQRFGEAKGAVELLLADCYVRRDQVAVLAFRGRAAEVLLPPTRSLVRAKRSLVSLPGGGGTPLAAGIEAAAVMADGLRRRGTTPTIVLLTDGRGNVARDGRTGRAVAEEDALKMARLIKGSRTAAVLIDTSPRPQPQAERLATAMGARYVALPQASSQALARAVQAATVPSGAPAR